MLLFINAVLNEGTLKLRLLNFNDSFLDYEARIEGSLQDMICATPPNLKGHPVTDIEEDHMHCWAIGTFLILIFKVKQRNSSYLGLSCSNKNLSILFLEDFIWDAGVIVWLIALLAVIKKRRVVQSIFWCCFGSADEEKSA